MDRFVVACTVLTALCLFACGENNQRSSFDVSYVPSAIEWSVFVRSASTVLTISGPDGYYCSQEYGPDSRPRFGVRDEQGVRRPEGLYRWELVAQLPPGSGGEVPDEPNPVVSGSFEISGGAIIPKPDDAEAAMVEEGAPLRSLFLDREGRLGMGTTVPQSQLHLKGSSPAVTLEDTTTGGGAFTLRGLEKGDGSLGLFDKTGQARWLVDSQGRVGINTTKPTAALTVDGYIEATKGFIVNGKPLQTRGFGLIGGSQPLSHESDNNNFFGYNVGGATTGSYNSFFGANAGAANTTGYENSFFGWGAGQENTIGVGNSFFGVDAGRYNAGSNSSFFGRYAGLNSTASDNSFFGSEAGRSNVTGTRNAFFGRRAGYANTVDGNSFFGAYAGQSNTSGGGNAFFGAEAGSSNTTGIHNSFFGGSAGNQSTGNYNSFFGYAAGRSTTVGSSNSFYGERAGELNIAGSGNSFFGVLSGGSSVTGDWNSFFGSAAGYHTTDGVGNSFFGSHAGFSSTTGSSNAFFGQQAGFNNTTGYSNVFLGGSAGSSNTVESFNTFVGKSSNLNPGSNPATNPIVNATAIGANAYVAQSNSLVLGSIGGVNGGTSYVNVGVGTTIPARQLHLVGPNAVFRMDRPSDTAAFLLVRTDPTGATPWKTFVVGTNATAENQGEFIINDIGTAVGGAGNRRMTITNEGDVTFNGNVYATSFTPTSSRAFKTNIRTFENALEAVSRLRGVRFDWKDSGKPAVGLIAEEVNEVVPEVVAQENGKTRGVNYDNLVAVLVEAVKEQQKTIDEQQKRIVRQETAFESLKAELEALKAFVARQSSL